jgi:alkanesulfonate monooxygenase SsuD/methylene tetrahydromethanopterin reductase-like flavin-dependent oxidoreductase (luciferase family)
MFMMPLHPPSRSMSETFAEDTAKALLADELGFEEFWIGEHFSAASEPYASPMMFMANLLARTRNLRFGTGVINLPNHHPAVVAGEAAQFDHMSGGRFMLGIGPGGLVSDFELFDNADAQLRTRKVMESIDFIEKIWAQDPPYDLQGEFWTVRIRDSIVPELGIGYMSKPLQQPRPPIHISLASPNSASARIAAERGWGMISANIIPKYSIASHWTTYSNACGALGKRPDGRNWRVARNMLVAPSDAEARDRVFGDQASSRWFYTYMREIFVRLNFLVALKPRPDMSDAETTPEAITEECVTYGSPKTVLDKLVALRDQVGPFETLLMTGVDWSGPNEAWERESMRLMADEVLPRFRQHVLAEAAE